MSEEILSWKVNADRGLYQNGTIGDIRKCDPMSLVVARECHHIIRKCFSDWGLMCKLITSGRGINYYGTKSEVVREIEDGKIRCNIVFDNGYGEIWRVFPTCDYVECIKPLVYRFGLEELV